jgi:hypothetical protein
MGAPDATPDAPLDMGMDMGMSGHAELGHLVLAEPTQL